MLKNGLPPSEKQGQHGFGGILGIQREPRCRSAAPFALPAGPVPKKFSQNPPAEIIGVGKKEAVNNGCGRWRSYCSLSAENK